MKILKKSYQSLLKMSDKNINVDDVIDFNQLDDKVRKILDSNKKNAVSLLRKFFMEAIEDVIDGRSPEY